MMTSILPNTYNSFSSSMTMLDSSLNYGDEVLDTLLNFDDNDLFNEFVSTMESSPHPVKPSMNMTMMSSTMNFSPPPMSMMMAPAPTLSMSSPEMKTTFTPPVCVSPSPSTYSETTPTMSTVVSTIPSTKTNKKRRRTDSDESGATTTTKPPSDTRRDRNREHAKRSRLRKKSLTANLEQSLVELKEENETLRQKVYAMIGKKETDTLVQERLSSPAQKFVNTLKVSTNKTLDNNTIAFLQSLSKDISFVNKRS